MKRNFVMLISVGVLGVSGWCLEIGLPSGFDLSWRPMGASTGKVVEDVEAVYEGMDGEVRCQYMRGVDLPAVREYGSWVCPAVTLWHLRGVDVERLGGECGGMLCSYDYTMPGDMATATTVRRVEWCPDVVVTRREGGNLRIRGGLRFEEGDIPEPYYNNGTIPIELDVDRELVECGGERYGEQVRFWLGGRVAPGYYVDSVKVESGSWDGN